MSVQPCLANWITRLVRLSGTWVRRAALTSRRNTGFFSGSKQSSPEPSQFTQAFRISLRCFWLIFEPVTSAATFCSSITFQSMNCSMSGWSVSTITILAARRVVPPDLTAPAPPRRPLPSPRRAGEFRAGAGAVLEQPRLAHPQIHDPAFVDEIVGDRLDEAGVRLRVLVGGLRLHELAGLEVDVEMPLARPVDAVRPVQPGIEPLRRVGRRHLHREHVDELVEEGVGILFRIEIAAPPAPIGPGAGEPLEHLLRRMLADAALLLRKGGQSLLIGGRAPQPGRNGLFLDLLQPGRDPGLAEIYLRQHVGGNLRPGVRHL